jgi:hypothetical protein
MVLVIVLSIINVTPVVLPAASVMISVYVPFAIIVVPFTKAVPLSVAVAQELLSVNMIVMSVLYVLPLVAPENVGGVLSIRDIVLMSEKCDRVLLGEKAAQVVYGQVPRR